MEKSDWDLNRTMMNVTSDTSTVFGGCDGENKKDNSNQLFSDAKLYQP